MTIGASAIGAEAIGAGPASSDGGPLELLLRLEVQVSAPIALALRLSVGEAGAAADLPLSLVVIDDAYLGGLDGAGGWPSAPSGRWRPIVTLEGDDISDRVTGEIVVQHADSEARTANFVFRPASVIQPMAIIGRRVRIWFAQRGTSGEPQAAQLIFTGVIERPSVNIQSGQVSCDCHDQMQEVFANTPRAWIDANVGGRWRAEVSGEAGDSWEYLQARLASVGRSAALDAQQQPRVLPWAGSDLRAETVKEADILDNTLIVDLPSRDELRTRIRCRLDYRFERLRGRGAVASYHQSPAFFINGGQPLLWMTTAMVNSAVEGLRDWDIQSVQIENPLPATYPLGPGEFDGFYTIAPAQAVDLAIGFEVRVATRWTQTLTESYTVDLVLPELESQVGPISEEIGATMEVPFNVREWGDDPSVEPVLNVPLQGDVIQAWKPPGSQNTDRDEVLRTLLDQAWVRLWSASRSGRVRFAIPLRPNLWLDNLVTVDTARLQARGKVVELEHRMDTESGEAITSAVLAVGMPGDQEASHPTWTLPAVAAPQDERGPQAYSFEVGTFVGGLVDSPPFDAETMIGFSTNRNTPSLLATNFYPHQLSMKAPDVDALDRDPLELPVSSVIETAIPLDLLELA